MSISRGIFWVMLLGFIFTYLPVSADQKPAAQSACEKIKDNDEKNLCRAKSEAKEKKFGYQNKNHSNYYCSLVKKRDMQNFCFAIIKSDKKFCDLIGSRKIEEECKKSF